MPQVLAFRNPRDISDGMLEKPVPVRTVERKAREAAALKANLKKRKTVATEQVKQTVQKPKPSSSA